MLSRLVNRRALAILFCFAGSDGVLDLPADNPSNAITQRLVRSQLVAHSESWAIATLLYFGFPVTSRPSQAGGSNAAQVLRSSNSTSATTRPSCRPR